MIRRKSDRNVYGTRVFVTGASSGIGQACAQEYARHGCTVTGVSRHTEEYTETFEGGGSLTMRRLDVTDEATVRAFIEGLPGVDIAVLCAGMGVAGPAETTPQELTRRQMEVNYFGTLNAARPCLTRMRLQRRGLLIVIGSIAGRVSIPMQSQYSASKYALEAFTDAVRMEMRRYGVRAVIIEPGDTKTGFTAARVTQDLGGSADGATGGSSMDGSRCDGGSAAIEKSGPAEYSSTLYKSIAKMAADEQNGKSPESVARVAYALAGRKDPPARVPVGADYKALMVLLRVLPDRAREVILSKLYLPR